MSFSHAMIYYVPSGKLKQGRLTQTILSKKKNIYLGHVQDINVILKKNDICVIYT